MAPRKQRELSLIWLNKTSHLFQPVPHILRYEGILFILCSMKFCLFHCGRRDKYTCFSYCISSHRNNLITIDMVKIKHDINFNLFHCVIHILRYVDILFICSINFYCCRRGEYTFFYSTVAPRIYLIIIYGENKLHFQFQPVPLWHPYS